MMGIDVVAVGVVCVMDIDVVGVGVVCVMGIEVVVAVGGVDNAVDLPSWVVKAIEDVGVCLVDVKPVSDGLDNVVVVTCVEVVVSAVVMLLDKDAQSEDNMR